MAIAPIDTLNSILKEIYADNLANLIPDGVRLFNFGVDYIEENDVTNVIHIKKQVELIEWVK